MQTPYQRALLQKIQMQIVFSVGDRLPLLAPLLPCTREELPYTYVRWAISDGLWGITMCALSICYLEPVSSVVTVYMSSMHLSNTVLSLCLSTMERTLLSTVVLFCKIVCKTLKSSLMYFYFSRKRGNRCRHKWK